MSAFNVRGAIYAANCTLAALLALFISLGIGIASPWWAALTVFIVSQPLGGASGAVVSRSLYRLAGTAMGVAASLVIVPLFSNEPVLLFAAVGIWTGLCVYVSLLDRSPRSYAFMLSGYTMALVCLPAISDPASVFDIAVARTEEVAIGVVCAALIHSLVLPRTVKSMFEGKAAAILRDARQWILGVLSSEPTDAEDRAARKRLASDLSEINLLGYNLRFDLASGRTPRGLVTALEERMVSLLPLLAAVDERLSSLRAAADLDGRLEAGIAQARAFVTDGGDAHHAQAALASLAEQLAEDPSATPSQRLASVSLVHRLAELLQAWVDCVELEGSLRNPGAAVSPGLAQAVESQRERRLHIDHGMAAFSGLAAGTSVVSAAGLAALLQWPQGIAIAGVAAAGSSVFAFIDDPRPMQRLLLIWSIIAVPVAALYVFGILPAIYSFAALAAALSPLYFGTALYLATPAHWLRALGFALVSQTLISLQLAHKADFQSFSSLAVSAVLGALVALIVTSLFRVISAEVSAGRILRAGWRDLAALADGSRRRTRSEWASLMLDRAAMLLPRLARAEGDERIRLADALSDLRVGAGISELHEICGKSDLRIDEMLRCVAEHFRSQMRAGHRRPAEQVQIAVDAAIDSALILDNQHLRAKALTALAAVRGGLFPGAAASMSKEARA